MFCIYSYFFLDKIYYAWYSIIHKEVLLWMFR